METIAAHLLVENAKARRAWLGGREYLVAPATSLGNGVYRGSQGALYYPPDETAKAAPSWDKVPIVVYHPTENGKPVSAQSPGILEKSGVGFVDKTKHSNERLTHELWFDVEATKRIDNGLPEQHRILPRLQRGEVVEISTGLYTANDAIKGTHNGEPYDAVARSHRPDHLAILPDQLGACSRHHGCGVFNSEGAEKGLLAAWLESVKRFLLLGGVTANDMPSDKADVTPEKACEILHDGTANGHALTDAQKAMFGAICGEKDKKETNNAAPAATNQGGDASMDRKGTVAWLTTNCDCWKGQEAALNAVPDDKLSALKVGAEKTLATIAEAERLKAALASPLAVNGRSLTLTFNAAAGTLDAALGNDAVGNSTTGSGTTHLTGNAAAPLAKPPTDEEWLASAPPRIRSAVTNAIRIENDARAELVGRLTGIAEATSDPRKKSLITNKLKSNPPLDVLEELMVLVGDDPTTNGSPLFPNYFGAAGGPVTANVRDDSDNTLPEFQVDWSEQASPKLRQPA